ncbi:MAG: hypothetical protein FJW90_12400, partial [Actinobacteria bacterium]|nr:hypothetical protein [Actinomycetota bacterium]
MSKPEPPPTLGAPLLPGVIHGVRTWFVGPHSFLIGLRHASTPGGTALIWAPDGEPTSAHCLLETHRAPDPDCGCGLYAYHPHRCKSVGRSPRLMVTGVVEAWGQVELYDAGFRAKYARPVTLFVPPVHLVGLERWQRIETVAERYEVPLVELPEPRMASEWCAREGLGIAPGVVSG